MLSTPPLTHSPDRHHASGSERRGRRPGSIRGRWAALAGVTVLTLCVGGCQPKTKPPSRASVGSSRVSPASAQPGPAAGAKDAAGYRAIAERDLFRPLVRPPGQGGAGGGGAAESAAGGGAVAAKGGDRPAGGAGRPTPSGPPDPTADLALTGIIETTEGLWALVEQISTRKGAFVGVGETAFGLTVKEIRPGSATLAQGSRTYELGLGAKVIAGDTPAAPAPSAPSGSPSPGASSPTSPPSGMPSFGGMSSDQRREAFQGWWNSMSEEDRQRFRERRGGFGGGRGGVGGGPGGRGGR